MRKHRKISLAMSCMSLSTCIENDKEVTKKVNLIRTEWFKSLESKAWKHSLNGKSWFMSKPIRCRTVLGPIDGLMKAGLRHWNKIYWNGSSIILACWISAHAYLVVWINRLIQLSYCDLNDVLVGKNRDPTRLTKLTQKRAADHKKAMFTIQRHIVTACARHLYK